MAEVGDVQVNATDYEGRIVIEELGYWCLELQPHWAVPAWEERGFPELEGPFSCVKDAEDAVAVYNEEMGRRDYDVLINR